MDVRAYLTAEMRSRILVLDGPKGTLIQNEGLSEAAYRGDRFADRKRSLRGDNDLLCLTMPGLVASIHERHLAAGADIIETNTFNGTRISQADFGMEDLAYEINATAARIARAAADSWTARDTRKRRFVAGSLGPTSKTASISPDVDDPGYRAIGFDELATAYGEQARGLIDGGVDLLIIETIFDSLNGKAALAACEDEIARAGQDIPIMVSGTIVDASGRNLSGQTVAAFLASMLRPGLFSVGLNCSLGARQLKPFLAELARLAPCPVSAHPNAGLPNEMGGYDEGPESMAAAIEEYCAEGLVNIVGGCCGSLPSHIAAIARVAARHPPRLIPRRTDQTVLSGLEELRIERSTGFVNVGERTNVAGSRRFARLVREGKFDEGLAIARDMVEGGAQVIDICMDEALIDAKSAMSSFINLLAADPEIARCPLMIDSSDWSVVVEGLKRTQGKCLVNSISLKEGEAPFLSRAREALRFGAAAVVMLFDEKGQADTYERKIEVAARAYRLLAEAGFPPQDIVFDPNILAVGTGIPEHDAYARDYIRACSWIKANLPLARISGGVSNLSFSFRGMDAVREALHSVFLFHAVQAGMDMGIVNPGSLQVYDELEPTLRELAEDLVLFRRKDASERLLAYAERLKEEEDGGSTGTTKAVGAAANACAAGTGAEARGAWRSAPAAERLAHALAKGIEEHITEDIEELRSALPSSLAVIEGPLMDGMAKVGELFGAGRMFLPQVIRSARVMKRAVAYLEPWLREEKLAKSGEARGAGKILLATVKGDVHDIGKSIVGVVLACNGYEILDLGVMVPRETILDAAQREEVDIIGVSGLITPSLEEMRDIARGMKERGMTIPLLVGGATTSPVHTAAKIAPEYPGPVVHVRDASKAVGVVASLLSKEKRDDFLAKVAREQSALLENWAKMTRQASLLPLSEARARRCEIDWGAARIDEPRFTGARALPDYSLEELLPYIDWTFFLFAWDIPGRYPEVLADPLRGEEARRLVEEGRALLGELIRGGRIRAAGVFGIWPANSRGDDLVLWADASRSEELAVFPFLRSQTPGASSEACLCLADFVAPESSGRLDFAGVFAVTAGIGAEELAGEYRRAGDDFRAIMTRTLADRLAEAFAEKLHKDVRRRHWGYAADEAISPRELLRGGYRGIRPAPGYPACPVHEDKAAILRILDAERAAGIGLTESWMMIPAASVSGFLLAGEGARYFDVGRIGRDQLADWAARKGLAIGAAEASLAPVLG